MAAPKLLSLLALALVAIVTLSSAPLGANALVADRAQVARHARAHDGVAKRKRSDASSPSSSGLCVPRPSSSLDNALATSAPPPPSSIPPPPSSTPPPPSSTPPPPSSTPSPPSSTSSSSVWDPNSKWGLAFGADPSVLANFALPKVKYLYTWSESYPSEVSSYNIVPMPMLWGYKNAAAFQAKVVKGYATIALSMNEPNEPSQSNMSPSDGANLWLSYMEPLKSQGYTLGSPACTDDNSGITWYTQFFEACNGRCSVDFMTFHAYTTNASHLIEYATTLHETYQLPVMITEFADQDYSGANNQANMNEVWDYAGQVREFVNNTKWLIAAMPFGIVSDLQGVNTDNALMGPDGKPTDLAYFYFS